MYMKSAFCSMSLRTGTIIVGCLNVGALVAITLYLTLRVSLSPPSEWHDRSEFIDLAIKQAFFHQSAASALIMLMLVLLYGAITKRHAFLVPCLIPTAPILIFFTFDTINKLALNAPVGTDLILRFILIPIYTYCYLIILSYYTELTSAPQEKQASFQCPNLDQDLEIGIEY